MLHHHLMFSKFQLLNIQMCSFKRCTVFLCFLALRLVVSHWRSLCPPCLVQHGRCARVKIPSKVEPLQNRLPISDVTQIDSFESHNLLPLAAFGMLNRRMGGFKKEGAGRWTWSGKVDPFKSQWYKFQWKMTPPWATFPPLKCSWLFAGKSLLIRSQPHSSAVQLADRQSTGSSTWNIPVPTGRNRKKKSSGGGRICIMLTLVTGVGRNIFVRRCSGRIATTFWVVTALTWIAAID